MLRTILRRSRPTTDERGQVVIIFAFAFVAIIMMLALLFDGAQALVLRRELRNASDAAAMAGANIIESIVPEGCSADPGPPPGDPQPAVMAAVLASVAANLPGFDPADVDVTCDSGDMAGMGNAVVRVQLGAESPSFFGAIFGRDELDVAATSAAINGVDGGNQYSVILLDNHNPSWPQQRRGCPSMLLSGGPTVIFDSSIYIDSECLVGDGGALSTNGNATTLQLGSSGPRIRITGEYSPQALTITPPPVEHSPRKEDPIYNDLYPDGEATVGNEPPGSPTFSGSDLTSLKVRKTAKYVIGTAQCGGGVVPVVLYPGVYKGGIELRAQCVALLEPGIYVLQGGGLTLGAQTSLYAVDRGVTTVTTWASDPALPIDMCHDGSCGVMIYNTGDASGPLAMDDITVTAGATFKVRSYDSTANSPSSILNNVPGTDCCAGTHYSNDIYDHMLIWQRKLPAASNTYAQPELHLNGGGNVVMTGTIYAPQAKVLLGGGSGGSGGSAITLTLQFIVWDLEISGSATFHFVYDGDEFVVPPDYGLIE